METLDAGVPAGARPHLFCLVPADRAAALLEPLREHFAGEPFVTVMVERRAPDVEQRRLHPPRRGHRRAPSVKRNSLRALPPALHDEAGHVRIVLRMEPVRRTHQNTATSDLVAEAKASDPEAVSELWWRFSERALTRLRLRLGPLPDDATLELLGRVLDELDGYDPGQSLTAWLDTVVDRYAEDRAPAPSPAVALQAWGY